MIGTKTEEMGSRKKLLAPVVVLLLCVVSLTGAAYAYSSSVTVTNNTVVGEEYVLEMNDNTGSVISAPISINGLKVFADTSIGATNSVVVKAETKTAGNANVYEGTLVLKDSTVTSTTASRSITFTTSFVAGKDGVVNYTETTPVGQEGSIGYTVSIALYATKDAGVYSNQLTSGTAATLTFGADHTVTLYYVVTVTATAESATGITFENNTPITDVGAVTTALATEKFVLNFTANQPA